MNTLSGILRLLAMLPSFGHPSVHKHIVPDRLEATSDGELEKLSSTARKFSSNSYRLVSVESAIGQQQLQIRQALTERRLRVHLGGSRRPLLLLRLSPTESLR